MSETKTPGTLSIGPFSLLWTWYRPGGVAYFGSLVTPVEARYSAMTEPLSCKITVCFAKSTSIHAAEELIWGVGGWTGSGVESVSSLSSVGGIVAVDDQRGTFVHAAMSITEKSATTVVKNCRIDAQPAA